MNAMKDAEQSDVDPDEWREGVYYDAGSSEIVTVEFDTDEGTITLFPENSDEPLHTFPSYAAFATHATDLQRIPDHAVENPTTVVERAYNKGFSQIMEHDLEGSTALLYADQHVELVDTRE